ncbi:MAG: cytochrome b/b6 domain-containing protein [Actinomycetota bacterium]|nr:cytochrome b/b6 domain-containing protein [Actinomycetota bacterium]
MDVTTNPSSDARTRLPRFTRAERYLHRIVAALTFVLLATAAALYFPDISVLVGNRPLVSDIHVIAGFVLPIPIVLALFSRAFRNDADLLNRFSPDDWRWLRARDRRSGRIPVGKFNAGQKLNSAFTLGWILVMLATGSVMFFSSLFPDDIRTGATFVHDWLTLAIFVVVVGHIYMAMNDAEARVGMRTGEVSAEWAEREHPQWANEQHNR